MTMCVILKARKLTMHLWAGVEWISNDNSRGILEPS